MAFYSFLPAYAPAHGTRACNAMNLAGSVICHDKADTIRNQITHPACTRRDRRPIASSSSQSPG